MNANAKVIPSMDKKAKEKVNILFLIGELGRGGGAEIMVINLANSLNKEKYNVHFCARADGSQGENLVSNARISVISKSGTLDIRYLRRVISQIHEWDIDLIHSHLFGNDLYGFLAGMATGKKVVQTIHGREFARSMRRVMAYRIMKAYVDRFVAVSDDLGNEMLKRIHPPRGKLCIVYNGVDTQRFSPHQAKVTELFGDYFNRGGPVIGTVGNLKPVKGQDFLVRAAHLLIKKYPEARFVVIGETFEPYRKYREHLDALVHQFGLGDNIRFVGPCSDVSTVLPHLDVYVLPSRSEGMSLSLLEAMSSERPIVATDVGGNPKLIKSGETGFLVPAEHPESLASRISFLLEHPGVRRTIGRRARKYVCENFSLDTMSRNYEAVYSSVLNGDRRRSKKGNVLHSPD